MVPPSGDFEALPAAVDVMESAMELLEVLEGISVGPGSSGPPERLVQCMQRLRGAMKAPAEADVPPMELSPEDDRGKEEAFTPALADTHESDAPAAPRAPIPHTATFTPY